MLTQALHKIAHHRSSLSRDEARAVMSELLSGKATDAQIAALLVSLHMKGETVEEIVGFAEAIRAAAQPISDANAIGAGSTSSALAWRLPGDDLQARPNRPLPVDCSSATIQRRPGSPASARSRATSLVEPIVAKCSMRQPGGSVTGQAR